MSVELTKEEIQINEDRASKGFDPYEYLTCQACGRISEFRAVDELRCSGWKVWQGEIKCPQHRN